MKANMEERALQIVNSLLLYSKQYSDGSTLGREIEDTDVVMDDAAMMIIELLDRVNKLKEQLKSKSE